jgi:hypothetical protein
MSLNIDPGQTPAQGGGMTDDEMRDAIVALVLEKDHVSVAELHREIRGFGNPPEVGGSWVLEAAPNVIIAFGLSEQGQRVLHALLNGQDHPLRWQSTSIVTYLMDGMLMPLPHGITARGLKKGYKSPRWLPCVFRPRHAA